MDDTPMTAREVLDAIARERARLLDAVDALGEEAAIVAVTAEGWKAKDVLAHCIHWEGQVAFGLGAAIKPPAYVAETPGRPSSDEWNALAVAFYRHLPLPDVRAEHERIIGLIVEKARALSDEAMRATGSVPWAPERPLWRFIGGDTFLHWPQHSEAIERAASPLGPR